MGGLGLPLLCESSKGPRNSASCALRFFERLLTPVAQGGSAPESNSQPFSGIFDSSMKGARCAWAEKSCETCQGRPCLTAPGPPAPPRPGRPAAPPRHLLDTTETQVVCWATARVTPTF